MILEEDPATYLHYDAAGRPQLPRSNGFRPIEISPEAFVEHHLKSLIDQTPNARHVPGNRPAKDTLSDRTLHTLVRSEQLFLRIETAADEQRRLRLLL
jgi:hypothetical protein